jgi:hypothetical protein
VPRVRALGQRVEGPGVRERRRWAELLRRIFDVDPLCCPRCGSAMRIIAFLTAPAAIDQILSHLRRPQPRTRAPPLHPAVGEVPRACG